MSTLKKCSLMCMALMFLIKVITVSLTTVLVLDSTIYYEGSLLICYHGN